MGRLESYGARESDYAAASEQPGLALARVVSQYKDLYRIATEQGEGLAEVSGRFRFDALEPADFPAVGDFVLVDRDTMEGGNAIIHEVLPRRGIFERSAVGAEGRPQIVAANVDIVFICMSLNNDYSLNRLERYLSLVWSGSATPVVVLTKADLCDDVAGVLAEVEAVAFGADVVVTSMLDQAGCDLVAGYLSPGVTASFIGSSGVGKSTLINCLLGEELLATSGIREDDKGRHTTTRRDLIVLPQGGIVIDTPGMRELGVEPAELGRSFADIEELATGCRFGDCTHEVEPGCAVQEALASGALDARRYENYLKLRKEARYEGLNSRQIEEKKIQDIFGGMGEMKQARDHFKKTNKRR